MVLYLSWTMVTAFSHRQASARPQCSCPCYDQHQEVWKRVITDNASRPSLAGCYWTDSVPSGCKSISVSAQHGSSVPDWTVYACHCVSKSSWWSSVRHNQQLGRTTSYAAGCQPTAPVHSVSLVQSVGMPYRII